MTSTHAVNLLLNKLPADARLAHRLPDLVNNFLSVAVLCDAGCEVFFHKHGCEVTHTGETILRGWRDPKNRLWRVKLVDDGWTTKLTIRDDATRPPIPLTTTPTGIAMAAPTTDTVKEAQANSLYECSNTHQLIHYYYACLNYPVPSSLLQAIDRGYSRGWRGLTSQRVRRHITGSPELAMGHLDQIRQGTRSTQPRTPTSATIPTMPSLHSNDHMADAPQAPLNARTNHVFMQIHAIDGVISSNQTGRFPITSNRGNAYVVVFYVYDANYICSIPIKSRSKEELLRAYNEVYEWLSVWGFKPLLHKMDNETLHEVKNSSKGNKHASSTLPRTCIKLIWRNGQYAPGKTTSSRALPASQSPSPLRTGAASPSSATPPSTCYARVVRTPSFQPTKHSKAPSLSMLLPWLPSARKFSST